MDALPVLYCDTFILVCFLHFRQNVFFCFGMFTCGTNKKQLVSPSTWSACDLAAHRG